MHTSLLCDANAPKFDDGLENVKTLARANIFTQRCLPTLTDDRQQVCELDLTPSDRAKLGDFRLTQI